MSIDSLKAVHAAQIRALKERFKTRLDTIQVYRTDQQDQEIDTPALLLEMELGNEGDDLADERDALHCSFTAHCLLSTQTPDVEIEVRDFALQVFRFVKENRWGLEGSIDDPVSLSMGPGQFKPGAHGYESWYVNWEQTIYLGDSPWDTEGIVPATVMLGIAPDNGIENKDKYFQIEPPV
ncbi:MAG: hypothetical protein M3H12_08870 [Chromatiales bacterium]|nr:hypothetical protein [Gammaproteobacteria bacterium]